MQSSGMRQLVPYKFHYKSKGCACFECSRYRRFSVLVSVFQRNGIGVSAWTTLAKKLKSLAAQGVAPLDVRIGVSAWTSPARPQTDPQNFGDSLSSWPTRECHHRPALQFSAMACDLVTGESYGDQLQVTCTCERPLRSGCPLQAILSRWDRRPHTNFGRRQHINRLLE